MKLSKNNFIFFKVLTPILSIYLLYFLFLNFVVYPHYDLPIVKTNLKTQYNLTQIPKEVDYLILGDSSGMYAINPLAFSKNSYSATNQCHSIFLSYDLLEKLDGIKIKKGIILTQTFIPAHYDEDIWKYLLPSHEITYNQILDIKCPGDDCSFKQRAQIMAQYALSKLQLTKHSASSVKNSFSVMYDAKKTQDRILDFSKRLKIFNGFSSSPNSKTEGDYLFYMPYFKFFAQTLPSPPQSELQALKKMTDFAKKQNINVFFVQVPFFRELPKYNTTQYQAQFEKILASINADNFKVVKNDLEKLTLTKSDYYDFNHLNLSGAKKFSKYLSDNITSCEFSSYHHHCN